VTEESGREEQRLQQEILLFLEFETQILKGTVQEDGLHLETRGIKKGCHTRIKKMLDLHKDQTFRNHSFIPKNV